MVTWDGHTQNIPSYDHVKVLLGGVSQRRVLGSPRSIRQPSIQVQRVTQEVAQT